MNWHGLKATLKVSLYGETVFALVYHSRDATEDIDAVVQPSGADWRLAAVVAGEQNLPGDWLNDKVKQFLAAKREKPLPADDAFGPGLRVLVLTAAYLLALELRACRPRSGRWQSVALQIFGGDIIRRHEAVGVVGCPVRPARYRSSFNGRQDAGGPWGDWGTICRTSQTEKGERRTDGSSRITRCHERYREQNGFFK